MFDRFTDRARKSLSFSRIEAERLGHDYIGPEHIFLGLLKEGGGVGVNVLQRMGLRLEVIQAELEKLLVEGTESKTDQQLPFTVSAKQCLEHAIDEARSMSHEYVGTEHLLIALSRVQENPIAEILVKYGLNTSDVRDGVQKFIAFVVSSQQPPKKQHWLSRFVRSALGIQKPIEQEQWTRLFDYAPTRVFDIARQEAERLKHDYIGPEHILIGLAVISNVLEKLGLDPKEIRRKVEGMLTVGTKSHATDGLPFSPSAMWVSELALQEADSAKSDNVTCEHILLALLQTDNIAATVLIDSGITLEKARQLLFV